MNLRLLSKKHLALEKRILAAIRRAIRYGRVAIFFALFLAVITSSRGRVAHAEIAPQIDLHAIAMIESSGNPKAVGLSGDSGLFQITPVLLKEYNALTHSSVRQDALFNPGVSRKIADWYLHKRIPQRLRHFKKPVTVRNIIIAWNAGIKCVKKGGRIPRITAQFLKKYERSAVHLIAL